MNYEYIKTNAIRLRDAGKDEKWLQDLIARDPSILELGDVELVTREKKQPTGGRIDLILIDRSSDEPVRYEVEIMLGGVDESHIIRTIEYWDVERRRYPSVQHRAVIIAEEITNRFFNVIGLLNRALPIIAIKLHSVVVEDKLCLHFIRVMDVLEEEDDEEESGEQVDRQYWVQRGRVKSLAVIDAALALFSEKRNLRVKYNRGHVAVGSTANNFIWFMPRKGDYILVHADVGEDERKAYIAELSDKGVECGPSSRYTSTIHINPTLKDLESNPEIFRKIWDRAESWSRE
jgi:hypothetical protein